jgi:hypothetical protein
MSLDWLLDTGSLKLFLVRGSLYATPSSSFQLLVSVVSGQPIAAWDLSERGRRRLPTHARSEHEQVQK